MAFKDVNFHIILVLDKFEDSDDEVWWQWMINMLVYDGE